MAKLRIFAKRDEIPGAPLEDLNIVVINDFKAPFTVKLYQQFDSQLPQLIDTETFVPEAAPTPTPPTPPPTTAVLWDSNVMGKWNDGKKRVVTDEEGNTDPNGKGIFMAASGDPKLDIQGDGTAFLRCKAGHGRFYICAVNYNSQLELDFAIMDQAVDNLSLKLRSRHQAGGDCDNRFGGFGCSVSLTDVDMKTEVCHNVHENSKSRNLPKPLRLNTWYKARFTCSDSEDKKSVLFKFELDYVDDGKGYQTILTHSHLKPKPSYVNKALFDKESWVWIRMNNERPGNIGLRNVKVIAV